MSNQLIAPYTNDARLKSRYLVATKFNEGHSRTRISRELQVSRRLVNTWIQLYLSGGFEALTIKKQSGRPALLNSLQMKKIKDYVIEHSVKSQGGRLMASDVQAFIQTEFSVEYQQSNIYRLLHELSLSWITSRSRHPKQSEEIQEAFKKIP